MFVYIHIKEVNLLLDVDKCEINEMTCIDFITNSRRVYTYVRVYLSILYISVYTSFYLFI